MVADHLTALATILKADATLAALVGIRVFGGDLPREEAPSMARKCLVVKSAGNPGGLGSADDVRVVEIRYDVISYGETPWEADRVRRAAYTVFKELARKTQSSIVFHRALHSGGPIQARDQDTDWPFVLDSWDVLAAEETIP